VLTAIACAPILLGWLAIYAYRYLAGRRGRRENAQWVQLTAALAELDAELDRTWAVEEERIRRYR
jgi:hypothetical protein